MRPSLSLCEHGLANRAERNSKPFKVWRHRWVLRKVPGTLRAGPNAVITQVINTWPGTWCVPNDCASLQPSLEEIAHLPSTLITIPLKHSAQGLAISWPTPTSVNRKAHSQVLQAPSCHHVSKWVYTIVSSRIPHISPLPFMGFTGDGNNPCLPFS